MVLVAWSICDVFVASSVDACQRTQGVGSRATAKARYDRQTKSSGGLAQESCMTITTSTRLDQYSSSTPAGGCLSPTWLNHDDQISDEDKLHYLHRRHGGWHHVCHCIASGTFGYLLWHVAVVDSEGVTVGGQSVDLQKLEYVHQSSIGLVVFCPPRYREETDVAADRRAPP